MLIPAVVCQYRQKRLSVKGLSCPCLEFLLKTYILAENRKGNGFSDARVEVEGTAVAVGPVGVEYDVLVKYAGRFKGTDGGMK